MKWMEFRAFMNDYFYDSDEIRIAVDGENPTIEAIPHVDCFDDDGYAIIIKNRLNDEDYIWTHKEISEYGKDILKKERLK
jgi:hypothetical protein